MIISRDVKFNEAETWTWDSSKNASLPEAPVSVPSENVSPEPSEPSFTSTPNTSTHTSNSSSTMNTPPSYSPHSSVSSSSSETPPQKFRSLRDIYASCNFALLASDPIYYEDAAGSQIWQNSMAEEISAIERNETWELVNLPEGKNVIGLKWVYRTKYNSDGEVQKYKARLVAKGYSQQQGVDFDETFSPVARFETVRTCLALAAQLQWLVYQFDVKSAFLNGELGEEVYVAQPDGYIVSGEEEKVYRLKKALYGLKQAPRAWYSKVDSYFMENGFQRSPNEPTLYVKKQGNSEFLIVCLYVDDMIYMGSSKAVVEEFKACMMRKFEMSDLGLLRYFLGLEVMQTSDGIFLSQKKYATDLLKKFNMLNCHPAPTPMNLNEKLIAEDGTGMADARRYRSMVGGLNYLSHSRPDIAYSVSVISRFMHHPTQHHNGAAKRIMRYIGGTLDLGIWYTKVSNFKLVGFSDSDWAGCLEDRKSTSGYIFTLGSGAISWSSKKQDVVALSSSEAEYVAVTGAACQAVWLRRLLADVLQVQDGATEIFCDNKATIAMTKNPAFHSRTKHIDIRYHFIRNLVTSGEVLLNYCSTNQQVADVLTKSLSQAKHQFFRLQMGVTNI